MKTFETILPRANSVVREVDVVPVIRCLIFLLLQMQDEIDDFRPLINDFPQWASLLREELAKAEAAQSMSADSIRNLGQVLARCSSLHYFRSHLVVRGL